MASMKGPQNEDTAFTTCPAVSELVRVSGRTTLLSRGFSETCSSVLPMPNSAKAVMQVPRLYLTKGSIMPTTVTRLLSCTIFLRPMRFMRTAAGIENRRNQMNTIDGMNPASVSLSSKSALT